MSVLFLASCNYKDPPYSDFPDEPGDYTHTHYGPPHTAVPSPPGPGPPYKGHHSPPPSSPSHGYGATATPVVGTPLTPPEVGIIGACPVCREGVLEIDFTCSGVLCAILLFPLGILCCLAMREKKCSNCDYSFG